MPELTSLQGRVLLFIQQCLRGTGGAPSFRRIAAHLDVDVRSAYQHVQALERKGCLERSRGRIDLVGEHRPPRGLPILGRVAAGAPILAAQNIEGHLDLAGKLKGEGLFLLRVKGDSMTGAGIQDGDLVLAREQPSVADGEIAVVVIGEEATIKRVRLEKNAIRLEPANGKYKARRYGQSEDVKIAGKVLMALREL